MFIGGLLHKGKHNVASRQQIASAGDILQVNNMQQLKQQAQDANGSPVQLSPINAEAVNGLTGSMGLPFGTSNARIDKNPLIGANGLSKNALNDIMFGNFKGLASTEGNDIAAYANQQQESVQGGDMRQILGGQENSFQQMNGNRMNAMGNMMGNSQPVNLAALVAANNVASTQGLNGFNINSNNPMAMTGGNMNSLGLNGPSPSLLGPPGPAINAFPGNMQGPNPALGMQMMAQLSNMNQDSDNEENFTPIHHHKRHHKHRKHHKKSTTKLLLRLLVDKMKDIYELDKMSASSNSKRIKSESSVGKIGLTLDDLGVPKDDVHRGEHKTEDSFKTKLSFPVTVSDETEHEHVKLKSDDKNDQSSEVNDSKDDINIQKILSSLNLKSLSGDDTAKKSDDLEISELTDSVSKDIDAASKIVDSTPKSATMPVIKGQEIRDEKANSRDTIEKFPLPPSFEHDLKMEEEGSHSEFHTVKLDDDMLIKSGIKSDLTPEEKSSLAGETNIFGFKDFKGLDQLQVMAPELMSVSSILNNRTGDDDSDIPEVKTTIASKIAKSHDFIPDKRKSFPSPHDQGVKIISLVPSDMNKDEDTLKSLTETISHEVTTKVQDGANYVKAAHVLGSVFKKVKDPVAKNSIETAIKAMLQVMRYKAKDNDSSASKKFHFPSDADTKLMEQIDNLNSVVHQMKRKRKEDLRRNKVYKKNTQ